MSFMRHKIEKRKKQLTDGKHALERRITELEVLLEKAKTDFFATDGALQECNYWLEEFDKYADKLEDKVGDRIEGFVCE